MSAPFTKVLKSDHDKAVTAGGVNAFAVFCALCRIRSDAAPEDKGSFPAGAARVARHCGLSTRTVKRTLPILAREGLVVILSGVRHDRRGDHEENRITLTGSDTQTLGRDYESVLVGTRIKKGSKDPKKEKGNEDEFSEFWKAYPRKVSRTSALKVWSKAKLPPLAELLSALEKQKANWSDPQFIPHPSTWLNARRWEDEVTTAPISQRIGTPETRLDTVQHKTPPRVITA